MNPELFKLEFKRGIDSILPYANKHKVSRTWGKVPPLAPEQVYEFPPYKLIFTVEVFPGVDCPMVSVSAPRRPIQFLTDREKADLREAFGEIFPEHQVFLLKSVLAGSTAFKMVGVPPGAPLELLDSYKSISV